MERGGSSQVRIDGSHVLDQPSLIVSIRHCRPGENVIPQSIVDRVKAKRARLNVDDTVPLAAGP